MKPSIKRKECYFSRNKIQAVDYKDAQLLKRFLNDSGKLLPARVTGIRTQFQRQLAKAVKRARHAGLLPVVFEG